MAEPAAEVFTPGTEQHKIMREYLLARIRMSQRRMSQLYARWNINERRIQAYVMTKDYENLLRSKAGKEPPLKPATIVIPYGYATILTIATYLLHTFAGRKPIFQVGAYAGEYTDHARNMELKLQYDADHVRLVKHLWQMFTDFQMYGVAIVRTEFQKKQRMRTRRVERSTAGIFDQAMQKGSPMEAVRELVTVYEGNDVQPIDPFHFFPDPRVPMAEVSSKGEFVFWRSFVGRHDLKKGEYDGQYMFVDQIPDTMPRDVEAGHSSDRGLISRGDPHPGYRTEFEQHSVKSYVRIDEGTIEIIPSKFGLEDFADEPDRPQKWLFTLANEETIIRAQPYEHDHDKHPVCVIEPDTFGYGFGQPGGADFLGPLQDTMSWLVNSHIKNVNTAVNNMFVVDPAMVEMGDLKAAEDGRIIRLKRAAFGQDVRSAIQQLTVFDVTKGHMDDLQSFVRIADMVTGVNDNMRAVQNEGGRKSATEVRMSSESAASRLAAKARVLSAQGMCELTEMMALNNMQYLSPEFSMQVLGQDGAKADITAMNVTGDFYFPLHDGTLPLDRVALLDVWREIFTVVLGDPQLRVSYDVARMFDWLAELGGARNIEQFKLQMGSQEQIMAQMQAGNMMSPEQTGSQVNGNAGPMGPPLMQ